MSVSGEAIRMEIPKQLNQLMAKIIKNHNGLLRRHIGLLSQILGTGQVESVLSLEKERQKLGQTPQKYMEFLLDETPGSVQKLQEKAEHRLRTSRLRYDEKLDGVLDYVNVISSYLRDIDDICKDIDFPNHSIDQHFDKLRNIGLRDRLSSIEKIEKWSGESIDDLLMGNGNSIHRLIVDQYWPDYSKVFILKQRIDEYEVNRIGTKSKRLLQELSVVLRFACRQVTELFKLIGVSPTSVALFDSFDPGKHEKATQSSMLEDRGVMDILKGKVDAQLKGKAEIKLIFDVISWGYESNVGGLDSKKPKVVFYEHSPDNYTRCFHDQSPVR